MQYTSTRRPTRQLHIGKQGIGSEFPVSIQSMTNTQTADADATLAQIQSLQAAGCDILRLAVPDTAAAAALPRILSRSPLPIVADIHFDYRLALAALEAGVHGLRINPGNIGARHRIEQVVQAAAERSIPIRIGINAGSLEKDILAHHGHPGPQAMVDSALRHVAILEELDFRNIKISLKASDVQTTMQAYRLIATQVDYPLHLGVTEAGTREMGTIKSAIGIGGLLSEGIGDTIRVSLTDDPVQEVLVAQQILRALGMRRQGVNLVSCPTCGRVQVDLIALAQRVEQRLAHIRTPIDVAVMGCAVNGPGEAREADYGIAGGHGEGLLMRAGEVLGKYPEAELIDRLVECIERDQSPA